MKIYVLIKDCEADFDYGWDYSHYDLIEASTSRDKLEKKMKLYEKENGGETWDEDDFHCCYVIGEVELED